MGECLISRRGGEVFKLPILDPDYPTDITKVAAANSTATFSTSILEHGKPEQYSYQWFVNGVAVTGAINSSYTMNTTAAESGNYIVYCNVTNKAGVVSSRAATLIVKNPIPVMDGASATMTYSPVANCELVQEDAYNWKLFIKGSGLLTVLEPSLVDVFMQGGGGGGGASGGEWSYGGGGGGGGYQKNYYAQTLNGSYDITIAGGATATGGTGGTTKFKGYDDATGGKGGSGQSGGGGTGAGGSGGGYWGDGNGGPGYAGGTGKQAFGSGGLYYGAGGGGGNGWLGSGHGAGGKDGGGAGGGKAATANTGSGGGGNGGDGASGIVIIRNAR